MHIWTQAYAHTPTQPNTEVLSTHRSLYQRMHGGCLVDVGIEKRVLDAQRHDPEEDADAEREEAADGDEVAAGLEPAAHGRHHAGDGEDEGGEDEGGVDDARRQGEALVQQVADGLLAVPRRVVHEPPHDEAEAQLDAARGEEEDVGREGREEDLVGHDGWVGWVGGEVRPGCPDG